MKHLITLTALLVLMATAAYAACGNPPGQAGDTAYASNYNAMAYCDGTNWVSMAGGVSVTVGGTVYNNTPGGADTYVQFNSGGTSFGGSSGLTWNTGTNTLTATNIAATAVTATTLAGTLATAAQPNITSVGTLTGLTVNGTGTFTTVTATNVYASSVSGTTGTFGTLTVGGIPVTGGANGDRIASGTTVSSQMVMNGTSTYVSLSTGATTWGYLSSATSWLPALGANSVSSTNVSTTLQHYSPQSVTALKGAGGSFIASGTTQVSTTNVGSGSIKFATGGTTQMTISGSNVGIGTANPGSTMEIANTGSDTPSLGQMLRFSSGGVGLWGFRRDSSNTYLNLDANNFGGTWFTPLTISRQTGNVGIGTATPQQRLDVQTSANSGIRLSNTDGTSHGLIEAINSTNAMMFALNRNDVVTAGDLSISGVAGIGFKTNQTTPNASTYDLYLKSGGNVGIGTTNPVVPLDVATSTALTFSTYGYLNSGGVSGLYNGSNGGASYSARFAGRILVGGEINVTSDGRLKNVDFNIEPAVALGLVSKLRPVSFQWKTSPGSHTLGFIAQDVEKVIPNAVTGTKTDRFADERHMDYNQIVAVSVAAIQQLKAENDNLREKLRTYDHDHAAIESLRREVEALKAARH